MLCVIAHARQRQVLDRCKGILARQSCWQRAKEPVLSLAAICGSAKTARTVQYDRGPHPNGCARFFVEIGGKRGARSPGSKLRASPFRIEPTQRRPSHAENTDKTGNVVNAISRRWAHLPPRPWRGQAQASAPRARRSTSSRQSDQAGSVEKHWREKVRE
jgi:hypothetical protein